MLQHTTTIKIASTLKNFVYYLRIVFSLINLHVFDVYLFILELTITHQIYANSSIKRKNSPVCFPVFTTLIFQYSDTVIHMLTGCNKMHLIYL